MPWGKVMSTETRPRIALQLRQQDPVPVFAPRKRLPHIPSLRPQESVAYEQSKAPLAAARVIGLDS